MKKVIMSGSFNEIKQQFKPWIVKGWTPAVRVEVIYNGTIAVVYHLTESWCLYGYHRPEGLEERQFFVQEELLKTEVWSFDTFEKLYNSFGIQIRTVKED